MKRAQIMKDFVEIMPTRQFHMRKSQQYENKIRTALKRLGVHPDDIETSSERMAMKKAKAWVSFYTAYEHCFVSHAAQENYADNMQVIAKLLEKDCQAVLAQEVGIEDFEAKYAEDEDVVDRLVYARAVLGVDENCVEWDVIDRAYKDKAKKAHPDMGGSVEEFKAINQAHKLLKKELM